MVRLPKRLCPIQKFITQYTTKQYFQFYHTREEITKKEKQFPANTSNFDLCVCVGVVDRCVWFYDFVIRNVRYYCVFFFRTFVYFNFHSLAGFSVAITVVTCSIYQFTYPLRCHLFTLAGSLALAFSVFLKILSKYSPFELLMTIDLEYTYVYIWCIPMDIGHDSFFLLS